MRLARRSSGKASVAARGFALAALVALAPVAVVVTARPAAATPAAGIVPGQRLGSARIGAEAPLAKLGRPLPGVGDAAMGSSWSVWATRTRRGAVSELDVFTSGATGYDPPRHTVRLVRSTSPEFRAAAGLGVGSTLAAVQRAYPGLALKRMDGATAPVQPVVIYQDVRRGIAFEFAGGHPAAAAGATATAVWLFAPGSSVTASYLGFYNVARGVLTRDFPLPKQLPAAGND